MGWWGSLAKKVSSGVSTLGQKVGDGVRAGVKYGIKNSESIANIAGKVENIAGTVGDIALTGAGIATASGFVPLGGFLGGVSAVSKGVSKGAGAVKGVANKVSEAKATAAKFGIDVNQMTDRYLGP